MSANIVEVKSKNEKVKRVWPKAKCGMPFVHAQASFICFFCNNATIHSTKISFSFFRLYFYRMHFFQLFSYGYDYWSSTRQQQAFIKRYLDPLWRKLSVQTGYQLNELESHKVFYYYPLFNFLANNQNYLVLRNRPITEVENKRLILVSVMATLYDDLTDEENWPAEDLHDLLYRKLDPAKKNKKSNLIEALDDELQTTAKPGRHYQQALEQAIAGQIGSAAQLNPQIGYEAVLELSHQKCGNSSRIWAALLDEDWTATEDAIIYKTGFINQILNDVFDVRKDSLDGVYSILRTAPSVDTVRQLLKDSFWEVHELVRSLPIEPKVQTRFLNRISCFFSFGMVGLHHLQPLEQQYGAPRHWDANSIARPQLVTDMAKMKNWWPYCRYILELANLKK
jgi:hypothetical protein